MGKNKSEFLESRIYRILFEYIKGNKEGVHKLLGLMEDIYALPKKGLLVCKILANGENQLEDLVNKNKDVITYLREYDEQYKVSLMAKLILNDDVLNTLKEIKENEGLIDTYLENAKSLEELKVASIIFKQISNKYYHYYCEVKKRNDYELKHIRKCYTDGNIVRELTLEEATHFDWAHQGYNTFYFNLEDASACTFLLTCENEENGRQKRKIEIPNFGFNGSKLPTEEELSSYEIPKELIKM